jgi:hypothetical protein
MKSHANRATDSLWAITSYFNPMRYRRRLDNYRLFRQELAPPLLTVELSHQAQFDLGPDDADLLVQLAGGDVMWQKERLLNLALQALPEGCETVAWLDCDVLFARDDWVERTERLLQQAALVQLFGRAHYLRRDWTPALSVPGAAIERTRPSIAFGVAAGAAIEACLTHPSPAHRPGTFANGLAWAARRQLLQRHRLFDANIIGGGDRAITCAAYGCFEHEVEYHYLNQRQHEFYRAWAVPFYEECRAAVSVLDETIYHLWHGDVADRGLGGRHADLQQFQFDPYADIVVGENGCWRWNSDKPALHEYVRSYFAARREDG